MAVVAVVDDDDDLRSLMVMKLRTSGYVVHQSSDGLAGLELIRGCTPDLVVVDWMMPQKSGIDVCRDIRLDESLATTPVLMVTSRSTSTDLHLGIAAGATSMLTKPFTLRKFADRVRDLLAEGSMASA